MDKAVAMMASGAINPAVLVQETWSLDKGVEAINRAGEKGTLKILLEMPLNQ
jgi:threonine dehydrogenase-like Zn-dependent dehydrogenase